MSDTSLTTKADSVTIPEAPETEIVHTRRMACDGGALGHPRVWLAIEPETGEVECPSCDKKFILEGDGGH